MKEKSICALSGVFGAFVTFAFGGWNEAMTTLLVFMVIDYLTGVFVALAGKSDKTKTGYLSSKIGFKGLIKKGLIMLMIIVACRLDILLNTRWYVRDATCIAFILNETISIIENAGVLIPIPQVILNVIDVLRRKSDTAAKRVKDDEEKKKEEEEEKEDEENGKEK